MTNPIENNEKRKRNMPRGILTLKEKQQLENGKVSRQTRHNVKSKTLQTLAFDLPLILDKINFDYEFNKSDYRIFVRLYFNTVKRSMNVERAERQVKRKVNDRMVWKQLIKEVNTSTTIN